MASDPKPGQIWRHWKGNAYRVLLIAHDSDTIEKVVVYQRIEVEDGMIWVRPVSEWNHQVTASKMRFELLQGGA